MLRKHDYATSPIRMYSRLSFVTKNNKKQEKEIYVYGTQLVISSIINLYIIAYQIGQGTAFTGYIIETKQRYREQGGKSSLLYKVFNRQK